MFKLTLCFTDGLIRERYSDVAIVDLSYFFRWYPSLATVTVERL